MLQFPASSAHCPRKSVLRLAASKIDGRPKTGNQKAFAVLCPRSPVIFIGIGGQLSGVSPRGGSTIRRARQKGRLQSGSLGLRPREGLRPPHPGNGPVTVGRPLAPSLSLSLSPAPPVSARGGSKGGGRARRVRVHSVSVFANARPTEYNSPITPTSYNLSLSPNDTHERLRRQIPSHRSHASQLA